jgi:hypothetical protein
MHARSMFRFRCIWLKGFQRNFARRAIDLSLPPPFLTCFNQDYRFVDAAHRGNYANATLRYTCYGGPKPAPKKASVMADDDLSDLEIAVLCDLLEGPRANLKARKRAVLDQLVVKELVEPAKDDPARFQLSEKAHHLLAERGVGISGG